ncbi:hypothetical protein F5Y08DRAFT_325120 [Xylaria arbuscula]|uniref:UVI-1 n=1 Tax=Xylaria arbuscula TaxID=114810 RepID=A0A9W8NNH0_9PEZI|nr:hypothetical protein F5Y08DRAFT_325120 [Xylaria arbuscula]KAJ3579538.1 hypothetical protein NPX13_g1028 [Xylaria arbuscula]
MHFSKIFAGIAMASGAMAALSGQQIADGIKTITQKSQALQPTAQSITVLNAGLIVIGQGPFPPLITGFNDIVSTGNTLISQLAGSGPIQKRGEKEHARDLAARGPDADAVFTAFREFVAVHQALLNILIGKAGLLEQIPVVGQPVATVLRAVEGVVDTLAIDIINLLQDHAGDVTSDANSLDSTLQLAISKYDSII